MPKNGGHSKGAVEPRSIQNRRARYDYEILETYEAGLVLTGTEVKSLYLGRAHLADAYCRVVNGEIWVLNMDIEPYEMASFAQHERRRDRKLLMHKREIRALERQAMEKGMTIIPLACYFKNGKAKLQIGVGRGKSRHDKREKIAKEETRREVERLQGRRR
jgi:SsrA-binding protein